MTVGSMFLIRWTFQIFAYFLYLAALWSNPSSIHMTILRWYEILVVELILEVFGAIGAVWGFSEIITLRNPETIKIWIPIAIGVGVIFLVRWILHLIIFIQSEQESVAANSQVQAGETRSEEVEDLEVADLQLKETTDTELIETTSMDASLEVVETLVEHSSPYSPQPASPTPTNPSTPQKRQRKQIMDNEEFC